MRKTNLIWVVVISMILAARLSAQTGVNREIRETINLGDFTAIIYNVEDLKSGRIHDEMLLKKGNSPAMSTMSKSIELYDFNSGDKKAKTKQYMKDINRDGINDIIIIGYTGLGKCCYQVSIHSLKPVVEEIGRFDMQAVDKFQLKDLDGDSIPEFIFRDSDFGKWNTPTYEDSPMPLLIWKYDGKSYRVANYKFSKYLLKQISTKELAELPDLAKASNATYDPNDDYLKYPSPKLWGVMLDYIYAGKPEMAEKVFDDNWPSKIPHKDIFYQNFQARLKKGLYWKQLENSNF